MKVVLIKPYFEYPSKALMDVEFYQTVNECSNAEILIGFPINTTKDNLEKLTNLKWIQLLSAGYDNLDLEYLKKRNIMLTNARGVYSIPIAEDVVCKILMSNCNALKYIENQKNHIWKQEKGRKELYGQTVGIIGTGSIASEIAKRLKPFGVKIIGYKKTPVPSMIYFDEIYTGIENLNKVISLSDYIVVTVDLNNETKNLLNNDNLMYMKNDASIINIARGEIINQHDLTEILKNKNIKYAGLDVFETEPIDEDDELWNFDNVYITPHSSSIVINNKQRIHELIIENIKRYKNGEALLNKVNI